MKQANRDGEAQSRGFEDLKAWQLARQLMIECHRMAEALPVWERYDLTSQVRRSSKSMMANIAEGYGRYHYLDTCGSTTSPEARWMRRSTMSSSPMTLAIPTINAIGNSTTWVARLNEHSTASLPTSGSSAKASLTMVSA
jgi:hypothetical protein